MNVPVVETPGGFVVDGCTMHFLKANSYTGGTTITSGGNLFASSPSALPGYTAPTKLHVQGGATLSVTVGSGAWQSGDVVNLLGNTTAFASGSTLGFDTAGGDASYEYAITNSGLGIVKLGAHTLTLTAGNTYTGPTTIAPARYSSPAAAGSARATSPTTAAWRLTTPAAQQPCPTTSAAPEPSPRTARAWWSSAAAISYTGRTTITAGTLEAMGAGGLGLLTGSSGLDIQGGRAVLDYTSLNTGSTPVTPAVLDPLVSGVMHDAHANGWLIDSSHAVGSTSAHSDYVLHGGSASYALGWTDAVVGGENLLTIAYTLYGDANLDFTVNGGDLNTVLSNYNQTGNTGPRATSTTTGRSTVAISTRCWRTTTST